MASDKQRGVLHLATPPRGMTPHRATRVARDHRLAAKTVDGANYYKRIEDYALRIRATSDIGDIIAILEDALGQTRALHTTDEVATARAQVVNAEHRIENLKAELELVSRLVREDQLTGALNRRGLDDALTREVAQSERNGMPLCAALLDIDNFKKINDSFGHQVGDIVLVHLVAIIRETVRTNDLIGRYGGEEFLLLLPNSGIEEASAVMNRLQSELADKPLSWGHQKLHVTFSAGLAARSSGETGDALVKRADDALYEAKHVGKNRVIIAP